MHIWYIGGADCKSRLFSKCSILNPFLGKFGSKKSKLSILPVYDINHNLEDLIPNLEWHFQSSAPKIHFWANLGWKIIPCLFPFKTFLPFLDIQLVLALYFRISLHSSLHFTAKSTNCLYFRFILDDFYFNDVLRFYWIRDINPVSLETQTNNPVWVTVLSRFIFTLFCSILTVFGFLVLVSIWYVLKKSQNISPFFSFLGKEKIEKWCQLINNCNCVHTKWTAHYVEVYMQFWSCFKVWMKQRFFDMKDFNCNYNLIYLTFFIRLLPFSFII